MPAAARLRSVAFRTAVLAGSAAAALAAPHAAAAARPDLVVSQAKAFQIAAVGWKTYADVTVKNAGNRAAGASKISVRLKSGGKSYVLKPTPNAVQRLAPGRTKKLAVSARLPAALAQGATFTLVACADAKRDVRESKEGNNCRTSGTVDVMGPNSLDLVDEALVRRLLTKGQAALYKAKLVAGETLPVRFRTPTPAGEADGHDAIVEIAATFSTLSAADKARVGLYAVPSALRKHLAGAGPAPRLPASTAASPCAFVSPLDGTVRDMNTYHKFIYEPVPAAAGKAVVWWEKARPQDEASAAAYAAALTTAWPQLTSQFKEPLSDAGRECLNAGDGRFDVYVNHRIRNPAQVLPIGIWKPTGGTNGGPVEDWGGCTNVPAYMDIRPGQKKATVAHELMHAIQFAYTYKECSKRNGWLDEGTANWAGDSVFHVDFDHARFLESFEENAEPLWRATGDYHAWLFWYALAKSTGAGTLKNVFLAMQTNTVRAAVNAGIPGGYAQQFPRYLRWLWNVAPVGSNGFPLQKSYKGWEGIVERPELSAEKALSLGAVSERTFTVPVLKRGEGDYCKDALAEGFGFVAVGSCVDGRLGPQAGVFQHFTFPDNKVRELHFKNGMHGKTGQHVEAWFRLADGSWKAEDWSAEEKSLCRDKESEDVRELYLVSSNVAVNGDGFAAENLEHELKVTDFCELVPHSGTFSGTSHFIGPGPLPGTEDDVDYTTTFVGNIRFVPFTGLGSTGHELVIDSGSFQVTNISGSIGPCTISSSGATFTLPKPNQTGFATMLVHGPTIGARVFAPWPEGFPDLLKVPVTYSGADCEVDPPTQDHPLAQFGQWMAYSGIDPILPDENGVIAATDLEIDASAANWIHHYTFSLAPEN